MKFIFAPITVAVALGLTACGEKSETSANPSVTAPAAAATAADAKPAAQSAEKAAGAALATANDVAATAMAQAKDALEKAQQFVGQGKLQEAQDLLKTLDAAKLTAEQQKLLQDLKSKIDQAIAAAKAAGGKGLPGLPKP